MKALLAPIKRILLQILLLLCCYFISRCCFTLINLNLFSDITFDDFLWLSFFALRYDLSAIFALNVFYFFLLLLPLPIWKIRVWEKATQVVFIGINTIAFLFELSDWAYYPFNFKRATADVLKMVSRKGDFWSLLPTFVVDYWYVPLAIVTWVYLLVRINKWICRKTPLTRPDLDKHRWRIPVVQFLLMILVVGSSVIGIRGGLQYIPIGLRNAVQVADSRFVPIVVNTPFSIITTYTTPGLEAVDYMPEAQAHQLAATTRNYSDGPFRARNVVLIMLESFSKEFTRLGPGDSYTPFLDSLMGQSLLCTQAYANAQHSAAGIPAIVAGIPTLMEEAFTTSNYGTNRIDALPGLLKKKGYETAFYHGGTNGTMSFDIFAAAAGYKRYYGRTEYHNKTDYDGNWGIWDEPFLQYFAHGLNKTQEPFMASVFTLSSHPPYSIPPGYKGKLPDGKLPIHPVVAYTDIALRKFFETAAKQPWFQNTLFVITADHCAPANSGGYYRRNMGLFAIPMLFYAPGDSSLKGIIDQPVQQIDILPSVLDYLHYDKPFFAFGNSVFRKDAPRFVITESSGNYQWLMNGYLLQTNILKDNALYAFPADSVGHHNLLLKEPAAREKQLSFLKAFIQVYREDLIRNKMTIP
jgi:glucan phosphoethanolaminetransferase (alkaline phosphatase superfamily)